MSTITASLLPEDALLRRYRMPAWAQAVEPYTDCFDTTIGRSVNVEQFVMAFYTTRLFKFERWILKHLAGKPSTDDQARRLARGELDAFAAWTVEARTADQLLMCDFRGRTRSWFMVEPVGAGSAAARTRLRFGSAVVPAANPGSDAVACGRGFRLLLVFHKLYSRALLYAAGARLRQDDSIKC